MKLAPDILKIYFLGKNFEITEIKTFVFFFLLSNLGSWYFNFTACNEWIEDYIMLNQCFIKGFYVFHIRNWK